MNKQLMLVSILFLGFASTANALSFDEYIPTTNSLAVHVKTVAAKLEFEKPSQLSNKKVLIIDTSIIDEKGYDKNIFNNYDCLLLVGGSSHVQKAMKMLLGFSVDGGAVLIDNVRGSKGIEVKRYAPNQAIPERQKAMGLLKML